MSTVIKTLKTKSNKTEQSVYPKTVLEAVVDPESNQPLSEILTGLDEKIDNISVSGGAEIVDDLNSTKTDAALSANQGRVLNESIQEVDRKTILNSQGLGNTWSRIEEVNTELGNQLLDHTNWLGNPNPHKVTPEQLGLDATRDIDKPVSTAQQTAIDASLVSAQTYTDNSISDLINGAPTTLDTLKEIADAMTENEEVVDALEQAIGAKANTSDLATHVSDVTNPHKVSKSQVGLGNVDNTSDADKPVSTAQQAALDNKVDKVSGKGLSTNDYTAAEKTKLNGIATGAEVNQNAFSNVTVGSTTIAADSKTDTLTLAGSNVTLTPDATNDKVTIGITKDNVTTALGYTPVNSVATTSANGLMSSTDKTKLDGIAANANAYTHPSYTARTGKPTANQTPAFGGTATISQITSDATGHVTSATDRTITIPSTLSNGNETAGLIKTSSTVTSNSGYTACPVISGVPYYKDTDTKYTHPTTSGNKHIPSGGSSGQILRWSADGTAVWGNDNNTTYSNMTAATSSAAGKAGLVPAPAAGKQASFLRGDGTWVVPTNTTYSNMTAASADAAGKAGLVPAPAAGAQGKFLRGDGTWQTPTNTTYSVATTSANGLMSKEDKTKLGATNIAYGTCSTAAGTAAKVVTIDGNANWTLAKGSEVVVKFTNTNSASSCTLNVNNTGAKSLWYDRAAYTGSSSTVCGYANRYVKYIYDGTYWVWLGSSADSNTTYSAMTGASSSAAGKAGLVPAPAAGDQAKFLRGDGTWQTVSSGSGTSVSVVNNLTSTSTTAALSAAQGKVLNDKIDGARNHAYSLMIDQTITSTAATNYTTYTSRSFQNYDVIFLTACASKGTFSHTLTIPVSTFRNTGYLFQLPVSVSGTQKVNVKFVNNTTISAWVDSGTAYLNIWGMTIDNVAF